MTKRVVAYLIDVLLVVFAASMLSSISYLNPQLENYNNEYNKYVEFYEKYKEDIKKEVTEDMIVEYKNQLEDFNYRLDRNNVYGTVISIVLTILYFDRSYSISLR